MDDRAAALAFLRRHGVGRGDLVGLALAPGTGLGLAVPGASMPLASGDPAAVVGVLDADVRPRWVMWSAAQTAGPLVADGVRLATAWEVAAVHRVLAGGWKADAGRAWARVHGLPAAGLPATGPLDLFSAAEASAVGDDEPLRPDGHLNAAWVDGVWATAPGTLARWAALALEVADRQERLLTTLAAGEQTGDPGLDAATGGPAGPDVALTVARAESAAELLCAELTADGLPMDRAVAEAIVAAAAGPRPATAAEDAALRARRDAEVLRHAPAGTEADLRSPGQVKALLRRIGVDVPDTRAWRLEAMREAHPLVDALLTWRKAERMATTFGYAWLDQHLGADGRLRGAWTGSDGAAGRMTASAGLHNMPADMRPAVVAEAGHLFVRADLGQVEVRVLAAVSGDAALARAGGEADMYAPIAAQLGLDRATAKVAVLGAMYGQTTGHGANALRRLRAGFPVAMAYLDAADRSGQAGRDLRTHGGRRIRFGVPDPDDRRRAAAMGRYARNAMVQGAAAELFKAWAATVRTRLAGGPAEIVLCLHDELLVHAPADDAPEVADVVESSLHAAARHWAPSTTTRFAADITTIPRWSDAKP